MANLRILMIVGQFPPSIGGGGQIVYNLSKSLKIYGSENIEKVVVVTTKDKDGYKNTYQFSKKIDMFLKNTYDVSVKRINALFSTKSFQIEQAVQEILNIVRTEQINLIHAHHFISIYLGSIIKESWNIPLVASSYKVPLLYSSQYNRLIKFDPNYAIFNHITKLNIDAWIGYSKAFVDELTKKYGVQSSKVELIYPGIEISSFNNEYSINSRDIISPGRLDERKNYEKLIEEIHDYNNYNNNSKKNVILTGIPTSKREEKYKKYLINKANNLDVKLKFLTFKFNEKDKIYGSRYACVLPSIREGLSLVMIESLAYGCPLIISDQANQSDNIIKDGVNGLIFDPNVNGDLMRRLEDLGDPNLRSKIIDEGKNTIKELFGIEKFVENHLKVYSKLVS
ncbi:MAG: glycosyltransferase family 4 protein [Thermoplasmata archaeon]